MKMKNAFWRGVLAAVCAGAFGVQADVFWYYTGANASEPQNWFAAGNWEAGQTGGTPTEEVPDSEASPFDSPNFETGTTCVFDPEATYGVASFFFGSINAGLGAGETPAQLTLASGAMRLYYLVLGSGAGSAAEATQTDGTWTYIGSSADGALRLGAGAGAKGAFTLAGGNVVLEGTNPRVTVGLNGEGALTIAGGTLTTANELALGKNEGASGRLVMTGGKLTNQAQTRVVHTGALELCGGVFATLRLVADDGAAASLLVDGGTLVGSGTADQAQFVAGFPSVDIGAGGATVEIAQGQSVLVSPLADAADAEAPGTFTKTGAGTLVVQSCTGFTGPIHVKEGVLELPVHGIDYTGRLTVDEGAQVVFNQNLEGEVTDETVASLIALAKSVGSKTLSLCVPTDKTATIAGDIVLEPGWSVIKGGEGLLVLTGRNAWDEELSVQEGTVEVRGGGAIATRRVTGGQKPGAVVLDGGTLATAATATGDFITGTQLRAFTVGAAGATVNVGADQTVQAALKGVFAVNGPFTKAGAGTLEIDTFGFGKGLSVAEGALTVLPKAGGDGGDSLARRFSFTSDLSDSAGGAAAILEGTSDNRYVYSGGSVTLPGSSTYTTAGAIGIKFTDMPFFATPEASTFECWWYSDWFPTKPFDILCVGENGSNYFRLVGEKNKAPCVYFNGGNQGSGSLVALATKVNYYFAVTFGVDASGASIVCVYQYDTATGELLGSIDNLVVSGWALGNLKQTAAYVNGSFWTSSTAKQSFHLDEVRVWNRRLSAAEVAASVAAGPDELPVVATNGPITLGAGATLTLPAGISLAQPVTFAGGATVKMAGEVDLSGATFNLGAGAAAWYRSRAVPWDWTLVETTGGTITKLPQMNEIQLKNARLRTELQAGGTRFVLVPTWGTSLFLR